MIVLLIQVICNFLSQYFLFGLKVRRFRLLALVLFPLMFVLYRVGFLILPLVLQGAFDISALAIDKGFVIVSCIQLFLIIIIQLLFNRYYKNS